METLHEPPAIAPAERLFVPNRKRLSSAYGVNEEGQRELRIFYGLKEVTFDDARYFAFGEQLVAVPSFTGEDATAWGPGYGWDELQPFLAALVDEGILARGEPSDDPRGGGLARSPLEPSACPAPRTWTAADCPALTHELSGRSLEIGYLELAIPVYRVAHSAMDADDRQVGEGNVMPSSLRLDRDTEWRVCQYAGSRYRDEKPMNVTALKAMIKYWKPMMKTLGIVRSALRARLRPGPDAAPDHGPGSWQIGELHALSGVVLGLPAFQMMKYRGDGQPPALDPVLSSLFRITDGIRMTTSSMMMSIERSRPGSDVTTASELHDYADHYSMLLGATGVCAGPKQMIDDFLRTAVEGAPVPGVGELLLADDLNELLSELPAILDYGLYGLQIWAVMFTAALAMSVALQAVIALCEAAPESPGATKLATRLREDLQQLDDLQIRLDYDRGIHLRTFADIYQRSWTGTRERLGPPTLAEAMAPVAHDADHRAAMTELGDRVATALGSAPLAASIVEVWSRYCREEQAALRLISRLEAAIDQLLDRPRPTRPLENVDLFVSFHLFQGRGHFRYLGDALGDALGVRTVCTPDRTAIVAG
jgi:hypothetical protein